MCPTTLALRSALIQTDTVLWLLWLSGIWFMG